MIKPFKYILYFCILLMSCNSSNSIIRNLEDFEGKITFQVSYPYNESDPFFNLYPNDLIVYFKDNKMYGDLNGWGFRNRVLVDLNKKESNSYVDFLMPSKNFIISMDQKAVHNKFEENKFSNIEKSKETKTLAGIECVKYTYLDTEKVKKDLWLAENINASSLNQFGPFGAMDEMLLEYEIEQMGMVVRVSAVSIEKIAVDDSLFIIPGNYSEIDEDSLERFVNSNYRSISDTEEPL